MAFKRGSGNPNSQLDWPQVRLIRKDYEDGMSQGALARRHNISIGQIGKIVRNESWQEAGSEAQERHSRAEVEEHALSIMPSQERLEELMRLQQQKEEK